MVLVLPFMAVDALLLSTKTRITKIRIGTSQESTWMSERRGRGIEMEREREHWDHKMALWAHLEAAET
jgi:hypothetical protein